MKVLLTAKFIVQFSVLIFLELSALDIVDDAPHENICTQDLLIFSYIDRCLFQSLLLILPQLPQHLNARELQGSVLEFILSNYSHSLVILFTLMVLSIVHTLFVIYTRSIST